MKSYTLEQLKFADELCYPADFRKLVEKHSRGTDIHDFWQCLDVDFRNTHKSSLISLIFSYSRKDYATGFGELFCRIIDELIG